MTAVELRHERDFAAWNLIFDRLDRQDEEIRNVRAAIAAELGFERVHVEALMVGDEVRTRCGAWHTVSGRVFIRPEDPSLSPFYSIAFSDGEDVLRVPAQTEDYPFPPMVTRAFRVDDTVF